LGTINKLELENTVYYLQLNLQWVKTKGNTIEATYYNGLNKIRREYKIGEEIPTVIDIDNE